MSVLHIVGIDPGLVHTGLVRMRFDEDRKELTVSHAVVSGLDADTAARWVNLIQVPRPFVFIEKYAPRHSLNSDERMVQGEAALRRAIPRAEFLRNTGVKSVVHPSVLQLMGVWRFDTKTHHQDLQSAARIAVLGAMRTQETNHVLAEVVRSHLDDKSWTVVDQGGGEYGP